MSSTARSSSTTAASFRSSPPKRTMLIDIYVVQDNIMLANQWLLIASQLRDMAVGPSKVNMSLLWHVGSHSGEITIKSDSTLCQLLITTNGSGESPSRIAVLPEPHRQPPRWRQSAVEDPQAGEGMYAQHYLVNQSKNLKRGVKEVVKCIRKGGSGICILAADVNPVDVYSHIPILC